MGRTDINNVPTCVRPFIFLNRLRRGTNIMTEENTGTGSNAVWAIALVVIVAIIAGLVYYSGILKTSPKKQVDINVTVPAAPAR